MALSGSTQRLSMLQMQVLSQRLHDLLAVMLATTSHLSPDFLCLLTHLPLRIRMAALTLQHLGYDIICEILLSQSADQDLHALAPAVKAQGRMHLTIVVYGCRS